MSSQGVVSETGPTQATALSDLELAGGLALGFDPGAALEIAADTPAPGPAFQAELTAALARPPCIVSFSGGRDSSAMLALAVAVARQKGLPLPIPVTMRFPAAPRTEESEWQEATVRHLGLDDWAKVEIDNELDLIGPLATQALRDHGLLWPFNTHFHIPILRLARGGTLVTGFGGDEVGLSTATARAEQVLSRRRRPRRVDALVVGLALAPRVLRRAVLRRREHQSLSEQGWLTDQGISALARARGRDAAEIPLGWDKVLLRAIWRGRYFRVCQHSFAVLGADHDVTVHHPWVAPGVLSALANSGGFGGLRTRADLLEAIFGDVLAPGVASRSTKAVFDEAMWTATARQFAAEWSGDGVPYDLVDPERLRANWLSPHPDARSATLIQAAWLHDQRGSLPAPPGAG